MTTPKDRAISLAKSAALFLAGDTTAEQVAELPHGLPDKLFGACEDLSLNFEAQAAKMPGNWSQSEKNNAAHFAAGYLWALSSLGKVRLIDLLEAHLTDFPKKEAKGIPLADLPVSPREDQVTQHQVDGVESEEEALTMMAVVDEDIEDILKEKPPMEATSETKIPGGIWVIKGMTVTHYEFAYRQFCGDEELDFVSVFVDHPTENRVTRRRIPRDENYFTREAEANTLREERQEAAKNKRLRDEAERAAAYVDDGEPFRGFNFDH